ncbi:MAG: PPC domain-containing protein, partial [Spirochaetia bacterium]|nr:PPC domain-containing protein [Spirochaetia bacterium]
YYYAKVEDYNSEEYSEPYGILFTQRTPVVEDTNEDNDTIGTATPITVGTTLTNLAAATSYEYDYYGFTATADTTYKVEFVNTDCRPEDHRDLQMRIYNTAGTSITGTAYEASRQRNNGCAYQIFTASADGTYYVRIHDRNDAQYLYNLLVSVETKYVPDVAEPNDTIGTAHALTVGTALTGLTETDHGPTYEDDFYSFDAVKGTTYKVSLDAESNCIPGDRSDLYLGLYDSNLVNINGTRRNENGTGQCASITFTAAKTGTFYINVYENHGRGIGVSPNGLYSILVEQN